MGTARRRAAAPVPRKPTHQAPTHSGLSVVSSVLRGEASGSASRPRVSGARARGVPGAGPCGLGARRARDTGPTYLLRSARGAHFDTQLSQLRPGGAERYALGGDAPSAERARGVAGSATACPRRRQGASPPRRPRRGRGRPPAPARPEDARPPAAPLSVSVSVSLSLSLCLSLLLRFTKTGTKRERRRRGNSARNGTRGAASAPVPGAQPPGPLQLPAWRVAEASLALPRPLSARPLGAAVGAAPRKGPELSEVGLPAPPRASEDLLTTGGRPSTQPCLRDAASPNPAGRARSAGGRVRGAPSLPRLSASATRLPPVPPSHMPVTQ